MTAKIKKTSAKASSKLSSRSALATRTPSKANACF
jgi:hypothetical protein